MIRNFDIYLVDFKFQDGTGSKERPALIVDNKALLLEMITSNDIHKGKYFKINDIEHAGLAKKSFVNTEVKAIFSEKDLKKYIGHLSNNDIKRFLSGKEIYVVESKIDDDVKELIEVLNIEN